MKNTIQKNNLAVNINRTIGVFYDNLDDIVDTYIVPWLSKGFDETALLDVAKYCYVSNIKTLNGMNSIIMRFYQSGCTTSAAISKYINKELQQSILTTKNPKQSSARNFTERNYTREQLNSIIKNIPDIEDYEL